MWMLLIKAMIFLKEWICIHEVFSSKQSLLIPIEIIDDEYTCFSFLYRLFWEWNGGNIISKYIDIFPETKIYSNA